MLSSAFFQFFVENHHQYHQTAFEKGGIFLSSYLIWTTLYSAKQRTGHCRVEINKWCVGEHGCFFRKEIYIACGQEITSARTCKNNLFNTPKVVVYKNSPLINTSIFIAAEQHVCPPHTFIKNTGILQAFKARMLKSSVIYWPRSFRN